MTRVAIVTGTGLSQLPLPTQPLLVETPHGDITVGAARDGDAQIFFLPRHGDPARPAHAIPHKANVEALARCKVERVLALNTVGALDDSIPAGSLVVPHDQIDVRNGGAADSFFDDAPVHVDLTEPYCPTTRRALIDAARAEGAPLVAEGVYAATRGPRLETPAEVRALRALGGTIVGMTGCPEAALARERTLCYASLCLVTNAAAGVRASAERPSAARIAAGARALAPLAMRVALRAALALPAARDACACSRALEGAAL